MRLVNSPFVSGGSLSKGDEMYRWVAELFPMRRSLSGPGNRETLDYLKRLLPNLKIRAIESGTRVFDWIVPNEWFLKDAFIEDSHGRRIVSLSDHGLHILGYSKGVDLWVDLDELQQHLYSLPEQPDAIPYVTSYYHERWGFCLTQRQRDSLLPGMYHVVVDAELRPGVLNYAELIIPGETESEILLSTYICHPMMANNELSGPVVTTALAQWLSEQCRRFTYRIVFVPETIGSLVYLTRHLDHLKSKVRAGFVLTCIGDDRTYSYMPSRTGNTLADRAAKYVLNQYCEEYSTYSFLDRGSDERQYCSPLIDLPIASIMRSKYGTYPEYHTSLDDLSFVTPSGLGGGLAMMQAAIRVIELNATYRATLPGEPQLGRRGLYPTLSMRGSADTTRVIMNVLAYADGRSDLLEIAQTISEDFFVCWQVAEQLRSEGLLELVDVDT